jgi:hypothetical protein
LAASNFERSSKLYENICEMPVISQL